MIYKVSINYSFDGRSVRNNHSTSFFVQTALEANSPSIRDMIVALHDRLKPRLLDTVHFMDGVATHVLNDDHTVGSGRYRRVEFNDAGTRATVGDRAPAELCLILNREVDEGRGGEIQLRGALLETDLDRLEDGSVRLADPAALGVGADGNDAFLDALAAPLPTGYQVMPRSISEQIYPAKRVLAFTYGGLRNIQLGRIRRSIETDEVKLAQRKLNQFNNRIKRLVRQTRDGVLSGELLVQAISIFDMALAFLNGLSALVRGALKIPPLLMKRPGT